MPCSNILADKLYIRKKLPLKWRFKLQYAQIILEGHQCNNRWWFRICLKGLGIFGEENLVDYYVFHRGDKKPSTRTNIIHFEDSFIRYPTEICVTEA